MRRVINYAGAVPLETDLLNLNKNVMVAIGHVLQDMIGTSTLFSGLGCVPTSPAGMTVNVNPGRAYSLQATDTGAYSSLAADARTIVKQGILLDAVNFSCPAPTTAGFSINYLVQGAFQEVDGGSTVLPYYNASNPASAYSGPNNTGTSNTTYRDNTVQLSLKAGTAATTGSQVTPTPDAGYNGLWVITVPYGATSITSGNISQYSGAPFLTAPLLSQIQSAPNGVVGQVRNVAMSVTAASATATLTADEIIVGTALGGQMYKLASFSKTINLATTGAGGMDTGTAPVSGFVALYAIYNPTTGASALLGTNATAAVQPNVYGGANLPAGYTASALVSVVPTNASSQFPALAQLDRTVGIATATLVSSSTVNGTPVALTSTAFPKNAKFISGGLSVTSTAISTMSVTIFASDAVVGGAACQSTVTANAVANATYTRVAITTPQQFRWGSVNSAGTPTFSINVTEYEF
jgi:hypothetical protein